jgi:hypothetical protein
MQAQSESRNAERLGIIESSRVGAATISRRHPQQFAVDH